MRKPSLTHRMAEQLLSLAAYAHCEADAMGYLANPQTAQYVKELIEACNWISDLANWKLSQAPNPQKTHFQS